MPRMSCAHRFSRVVTLVFTLIIGMLESSGSYASVCFGPYVDYSHAIAACGDQSSLPQGHWCVNETQQNTCGGYYHAVKLYSDCLAGTSCIFPYYINSCPAGETANPETGECETVENNPNPTKNFGSCQISPSDLFGNPIKAATGNKFAREVDIEGFGHGILRFERTYNSGLALLDTPAPVWRHTYERRLRETALTSEKFRAADRPDGRSIYFSRRNLTTSTWETDEDVHETLEHTTSQGVITAYQLTLTDKSVEIYDGDGVLQSITDLAGNTQTLTYNVTSGLLERVDVERDSTTTGEYLLYGYDTYDRLTTLTDHTGRVWTYTYDGNGNLLKVYYPDGSTDTHENNPYRLYHYENGNFPSALTGISDWDGTQEVRYATYAYDSLGRAIASYHGQQTGVLTDRIDGVTITYDDATTRTVTNSNGISSTYSVINQLGTYKLTGITGPGCTSCGNGDASYTYDSTSNELLTKTENGVVTEYGNYNSKGYYRYKIEAKGDLDNERRTDYTYDTRYYGKIATRTEPSVKSGSDRVTSYGYDDFGNRTSETITGFAPNGQGGWVSVNRSTNWKYGGTGPSECPNVPLHQLCEIDGPRTDVSDVTTFDYYLDDPSEGNNRARLKQVTDATGELIRSNIQYTATGKVASEDRLNNLSLTYSYYPGSDRLESLTESDGTSDKVTRWTYLATGEVETITTADGTADATTLTFGYDDARRLTRITDGLGNYIEYILDTEGNREEENRHDSTDTLKKALTQTFDNYNRINLATQANEAMDYDFATDGTLDQQTNGTGSVTDFGYDSLKRLLTSTQDLGGLGAVTQYGYDAGDRLTQVIDSNTGTTTYQYDDLGNLLQTDSPDTGTTIYTYDDAGNLKTRTDAKGQQFTYSYDILNRLTNVDAPGTVDDITYVYDDTCTNDTGRLCSVTMGSTIVTYNYDAFGNVTTHQQVTYEYDAANRLKTITYPSGAEVTYSYDAAGRVNQVDLTEGGNTTTLASGITYAPFGAVEGLTYGNLATLTQSVDAAYRLTDQTVPGALDFDYTTYDGNGNLKVRSDNLQSAISLFSYDALNRLDTAGGPFGNRDYDYDLNGNRTNLVSDTVTTTYGYTPSSNRIVTETGWTYTLDANGNTAQQVDVDGAGRLYGYSSHNRLESATDRAVLVPGNPPTYQDTVLGTYGYNGLGQRANKTVDGITTQYRYGTDGALLAELDGSGSVVREYINLNGQLLATQAVETVPVAGEEVIVDNDEAGTSSTGTWATKTSNKDYGINYRLATKNSTPSTYRWTPTLTGGTYEVYAWWVSSGGYSNNVPYTISHNGQTDVVYRSHKQNGGSWQLLGTWTFDGSGNEYIEVSNANGKASADAIRLVSQAGTTTQTNLYYVHNDHLGTPQAMTDDAGATVWRATYDPFGDATIDDDPDNDGNSVTLNVRFPGQYFDEESGLHYNYFRYYDPETGRYITSDPIGLRGGVNTYGYVGSNPLNAVDSLGLAADSITNACAQNPFYCTLLGGSAVQGAQSLSNSSSTMSSTTILPGGDTAPLPEDAGKEAADDISDEPGFCPIGSKGPNNDGDCDEKIRQCKEKCAEIRSKYSGGKGGWPVWIARCVNACTSALNCSNVGSGFFK